MQQHENKLRSPEMGIVVGDDRHIRDAYENQCSVLACVQSSRRREKEEDNQNRQSENIHGSAAFAFFSLC